MPPFSYNFVDHRFFQITETGVLQPVIVRPKMEKQIQYGANVPTKSELSKDWSRVFFRLYSNLYRARLYAPLLEMISVEKCTLLAINNQAFSLYQYKPISCLGVLEKIFQNLTEQDTGNYLLYHLPKHEAFVALLKQTDEQLIVYRTICEA